MNLGYFKNFSLGGQLLVFLSLACFSNLGFAEEEQARIPLQASVEKVWSVDAARQVAFKDAKMWVDLTRYPESDPNYKQHYVARLLKKERVGLEMITYFDRGFYSVSEEGSDRGFYYTGQGKLYAIDFDTSRELPIKSYKHAYPSGRLMDVTISVAPGEDFVFKPNGQLVAHWLGDRCYDANGKITMSRSVTEKAAHEGGDALKTEFK
jgi:hypothetical protein